MMNSRFLTILLVYQKIRTKSWHFGPCFHNTVVLLVVYIIDAIGAWVFMELHDGLTVVSSITCRDTSYLDSSLCYPPLASYYYIIHIIIVDVINCQQESSWPDDCIEGDCQFEYWDTGRNNPWCFHSECQSKVKNMINYLIFAWQCQCDWPCMHEQKTKH